MMSTRFVLMAAGFLLAAAQTTAQQATHAVGPAQLGWAVNRADLAANVKFEPIFGRDDAMVLRSNTHVVKTGLDFGDGTIEFDLAPLANGHFTGITFRRQSFTDHENIYVRFHRSGDFMALQYAPRVNGSSTWQLYQEFTAETQWPREAWTHVKVDVKGSKMDVFVGDAQTPTLTVPRLRNGTTSGEIGFWARVNDQPKVWAAAISNLKITKAPAPTALTAAAEAPVQFVWNWQLSEPTLAEGSVRAIPASIAKWTAARAEESGLGEYQQVVPRPEGPLRCLCQTHHSIGCQLFGWGFALRIDDAAGLKF